MNLFCALPSEKSQKSILNIVYFSFSLLALYMFRKAIDRRKSMHGIGLVIAEAPFLLHEKFIICRCFSSVVREPISHLFCFFFKCWFSPSNSKRIFQNCMGNLGRREVGLPLFDQGDYDHHENPLRNAPSSDYYLTTVIENPTKVSFFRIDLKR